MKESDYTIGQKITVNDIMQEGYTYELVCAVGKNFAPEFNPQLTPSHMLELGVFEGKYLNDCTDELPEEWYEVAQKKGKLCPNKPDPSVNCFGIKSRQSLQIWRQKDWILYDDPDVRGWFQWYCRYYLGRRVPSIDTRQIKRWRAFARHLGQVKKNCEPGNLSCRPRQRQALLQWAYDPFI